MRDVQDLHEPSVAREFMLNAFAAAPKRVGYPPMQWGDAGGDAEGDGLATRRVTMREAADLLGVSKEAIRKRVVRGTLPSEMGRTDGGTCTSRPAVTQLLPRRQRMSVMSSYPRWWRSCTTYCGRLAY